MSDDLLAGIVGDQVMLDQERWMVLEIGNTGVVRRDHLKIDERSRRLLEQLGAWKGADADVVTDAWGSPVVIRRTRDGVDVIRIGPDHILDTGDDRNSARRFEMRKPLDPVQ
jgi:hypothetical protein